MDSPTDNRRDRQNDRQRGVDGGQVTVEVHGLQWDDGTIERTVVCDAPVAMGGQEVRAVSAALAEAAERIVAADE